MDSVTEEAKDFLNDELVDSSEEEELKKEEALEQAETTLTITGQIPQQLKAFVICESVNAQALFKIIFDEDLEKVGKADTTYKKKTSESLSLYLVKSQGLLVALEQGSHGAKGQVSSDLAEKLFDLLKNHTVGFYLVLDSIYKTNYSTTDTGYISSIGDEIPLKFYKTSHVSRDHNLTNFLSKYQPAGVLNIFSGLGAGLLIHAEMNGVPALCLTGIVDSHYVTAETLQGYAPIINGLLSAQVDLGNILKFKKFKEVLKEVNSRDHNIYN